MSRKYRYPRNCSNKLKADVTPFFRFVRAYNIYTSRPSGR